MRFFFPAVAALATVAFAQDRADLPNPNFNSITKPEQFEEVQAGTTYKIEWSVPDEFKDVLINIIYTGGPTNITLAPKANITRDAPNSGSFDWEVPLKAAEDPFSGLLIESVEDTFNDYQWSMGFYVVGDPDASSSVSVSSAESTATTATTAPPTSSASSESSAPTSSPPSDSSSDAPTTTPSSGPSGTSDPATSQSSEEPSGGAQVKASGFALVGMLIFAVNFLL